MDRTRLVESRFDRQVRAFGASAQARLRDLTVAVVGVGGAGSLVVQGLAHLGIGRLLVVDPDVVETTNLNRVVGATPDDARRSRPKVEVAARLARAVDPALPVAATHGGVLDAEIWQALRCADVIVGAVDGHAPRWALNVLAVQYGRLYIDIGVGISRSPDAPAAAVSESDPGPAVSEGNPGPDVDEAPAAAGTLDVGGHIAVVRQGGPCLLCQCGYDPTVAALELDPAAQAARRAAGYLPADVDAPAPSVLFLNQAVVAFALGEVLNWVWPWRPPATHLLVDLVRPAVVTLDADRVDDCPACGSSSVRGLGDAGGIPPFPSPMRSRPPAVPVPALRGPSPYDQ
ncbi:HesA/MoeB/ThiF family protein [Protofrankia symbiont of Coriaria ruscifolia]|uniref:HesA/MoeB/ThiF family protein n=1 Tax=Protofrankia symbiont of Coriaria ruscifolia TaxID=1306542 RepID=UPI0013EF8A9A|nr:ThiF family adenylyltransferase [Protofrankia symbiont of Coriaria ruscifolia]